MAARCFEPMRNVGASMASTAVMAMGWGSAIRGIPTSSSWRLRLLPREAQASFATVRREEEDSLWRRAKEDPVGFWGEAAKGLSWKKPFSKVLSDTMASSGHHRWFEGGKINACWNAIDRHLDPSLNPPEEVEKMRRKPAIIYDSPVTNTKRAISYGELQERVANFAAVLRNKGVAKGDRVVIYMPMIPEAVIAILACSRIGATHSVVFGGFASEQLAIRIDHCQPKVLVTASCGIEGTKGPLPYKPLVDRALELATHKLSSVILYQRPQHRADLRDSVSWEECDWEKETSKVRSGTDCVPVASDHPLYILYTSGTTGNPKGVVRDTGGYLTALHWSLPHIYGIEKDHTWWAASDIGWVVGISYIVYAPLLLGATSILYEGKPVGTPDAGAFWRVIADHRVHSLFTAPTAFRAIKKEDPKGELIKKYDLSKFQVLWLAGERADADTIHWAEKILARSSSDGSKVTPRPVIDHWWQTETGWPIAATRLPAKSVGAEQGVKPRVGYVGKAIPGWDVQVLDSNHRQMPRIKTEDLNSEEAIERTMGDIVVKLPLPPGALLTLYKDEKKFKETYLDSHPGYYHTGDSGVMDQDGYIAILGRTDDIINTAGHRLSTGALEEALSSLDSVAECAVIGVQDAMKGEVPVGILVLKSGLSSGIEAKVLDEAVQVVRKKIGPVAAFKVAVIVPRLPKTRSGKVLRATMRRIANGSEFPVPPTIDDPAILDEIKAALEKVLPSAKKSRKV